MCHFAATCCRPPTPTSPVIVVAISVRLQNQQYDLSYIRNFVPACGCGDPFSRPAICGPLGTDQYTNTGSTCCFWFIINQFQYDVRCNYVRTCRQDNGGRRSLRQSSPWWLVLLPCWLAWGRDIADIALYVWQPFLGTVRLSAIPIRVAISIFVFAYENYFFHVSIENASFLFLFIASTI